MRKYVYTSLLVFLILFASCSFAHSAYASSPWSIQHVDDHAQRYAGGRIAIDSEDNPHLVYTVRDLTKASSLAESFLEVRYARWNGSNWNITTAIEDALCLDFRLDSNDNPHILYEISVESVGPQQTHLIYATWTEENGWVPKTVYTYSVACSLALDSTGNPHVVYFAGEHLKYASWNGTNWDIQTVNTPDSLAGLLNPHIFLELDSNDIAHIACSFDDFNVHYVVGDGDNWKTNTVLENYELSDMVLDSTGKPHTVCFDQTFQPPRLTYAKWTGENWESQNFPSAPSDSSWQYTTAKLSLDSQDLPRIVYNNGTRGLLGGILMYATLRGNNWDFQTIDSNDTLGVCSIALDSKNNPHICYYSPQGNEYLMETYGRGLHYATADLSEASSDVLDSTLLPVTAAVVSGTAILVAVYILKKRQ